MNWLLMHSSALLIAIPLFAAFLAPLIDRVNKKAMNVFVIAVLIITQIIMMILAWDVFTGITHVYVMGASNPAAAIPAQAAVPVRIVFEVDGMGAFMGLISTTISLAAAFYSIAFVKKETGQGRYYTLLLLMVVGMIGMEFTGDIFNLFVFLEILSISSAGLIAFRFYHGDAVEGAFKYIVISSLGALMVLFSIGLLYGQYNLLNMAALASVMKYTVLDKIALALLVAAFAMKCGAVPMHMWTPDAYTIAPAPITAMLVVASQVSLYALFRVCFTLYGMTLNLTTIGIIIIALGLLSMFVGVTMALPQKDIKRLMSYHAISQTGYMLLGVGVGLYLLGQSDFDTYGMKAMEGGIFHIINHAMYKGLLFLTAGAIFYRIGTRNLNEMGGLAHSMKCTTVFFIIGALAIAGIPPFNGFASKLLIYESAYHVSPILSIIAMLVSIITLASFVKVFHSAFMGPPMEGVEAREVPKSMLLGMSILTAGIILFGLFPDIVVSNIVHPAVQALADQAGYINSVIGGV
ncbi:MAG: proton-conducting transporter membrane subunit [Candidatus Thermoplasmatota archaeon]|nr:proton-conducting transporter membrane subunit [Candidatus Thermoplasmatota archaeon]